jgi:hypothetical protein
MFNRLRRLFAVGAIAALLAIAVGSAGSVSAAIDPVAFQKLGCTNGDYSCYYARLYGGYPLRAPYCDANGCTYAAVGEAFYGAPYYANSYIAANYAYAGYPYGYPYGAVAYPYAAGTSVYVGGSVPGPANTATQSPVTGNINIAKELRG